jgi:hypothetical protein
LREQLIETAPIGMLVAKVEKCLNNPSTISA